MSDLFVIVRQNPRAGAYPRPPGTQQLPYSFDSNRHRLFLMILGLFLLLPNHNFNKIRIDRLTCNRLQVTGRMPDVK